MRLESDSPYPHHFLYDTYGEEASLVSCRGDRGNCDGVWCVAGSGGLACGGEGGSLSVRAGGDFGGC